MNIISLVPSATEIVSALGFKNELVGRSHECDYPENIKNLPICTGPKFKIAESSRAIDGNVREVLSKASSVYWVDIDLLDKLKPHFILTQSQCEVCAVNFSDVKKASSQLIHSKPEIIDLQPNLLEDIWKDIKKVSQALGAPERGENLVFHLRNEIERIRNKVQKIQESAPTVISIEWMDPLMFSGNWIPELAEFAGAKELLGKAGKHSQYFQWKELLELDPDYILIMPCGFPVSKSLKEIKLFKENDLLKKTKAYKENKIFLIDGNHYFNRPGPRILESLEILVEIFYPNSFHFSHNGKAFVPLAL